VSYIGAEPTTAAFPFDQFSGNGTTTAFTLTYAPASTTSIIVAISGVVQNPNLYSVIGTTITFSPAPPTGTNNISVLYLGLPVIGVSNPGNTAYFSSTSFTATGGQTTFTPSGSYTPGFINVIRNGAQLAPADYTATNGTTVTLANACTAGDIVVIEVFTLTSLTNALPLTGGTVTGATTFNTNVTVNGALASGFTGMKNRIINGGMVIDQRNNGASVTPANNTYTLDRWKNYQTTASKYSVQRNAGAVTPPAGFTNYLGITSLSSYAVLSSDYYTLQQVIEGFNTADLGWGTASAATVTLSFWVRSSLTGTFGGSLFNSAGNRSYPFSYTISAANTWEQKSVTIAGDTTGTWATDNTAGIQVCFGLGAGSTFTGPAGAWAGALYTQPTSTVSVVGTNGATFYITGVQLERGSNATSFEFRDYGSELVRCQRYYYRVTQTGSSASAFAIGSAFSTGVVGLLITFPVTMRTIPSALEQQGTASNYQVLNAAGSQLNCNAVPAYNAATTASIGWVNFTVASGLVAGNASSGFGIANSGAYLGWSAEL
jgi:hypothetical protein